MNDLEKVLSDYAEAVDKAKTWNGHDRKDTCGASEIFGCIRRLWYEKNDIAHDDDYEDRYGAKLRGNLIEDHFVVPAIRDHMPDGFFVDLAGADQKTRIDGFLSCTPDGVVVNENGQDRTFCGVTLKPGGAAALEIKSIDPRIVLDKPKPVHAGQAQVQMGLLRRTTNYQPDHCILIYVNTSFFDDIAVFVVDYNNATYESAKTRAKTVFQSKDSQRLSPEGAIAGGAECDYCPWFRRCRQDNADRVPSDGNKLNTEDADILYNIAVQERRAADVAKEAKQAHDAYKEKVKTFLQDKGIRRHKGDGWSVSWSSMAGRKTISKKLIEDAGHDPEDFMSEGVPGDKLTVTMKERTET